MTRIGIIGAGIAGLQLGLFLRHAGFEVTIYTEQTADQLLCSRLPNAVIRSAPTRARERQLGVAHWDDEEVAVTHLTVRVRGERTLSFSGAYDEPCMSVDMRIYCARLLEDFSRRGGHLRVGTLQVEDVATLAGEHDLVVVATGRGALGTLFPRIAEHSPFTSPQRLVVGGFFRGVAPDSPLALEVTYIPGQGEILSFPVVSFEPGLTVIAFESIAGGAFETMARMHYVDNPRGFEASALDLLRTYAPSISARIDPAKFTISRQLDLCHAAITPTVRAGYRRLDTGRYVIALGDAHVVNDPIIGQGANTASYAAWTLGEAILDAQRFDEAFCHDVEQRIWAFTQPVTEGTNGRLRPPQPHMLEVLRAAVQHQTVADAYAWGFNHPEHFWAAMSTPEQARIFLADVTQLETAPVMASGY